MIEVNQYRKFLEDLCERHLVGKLYLFGSATSDKFNPNSDIDFLVRFNDIDLKNYFSNFLSFKQQLEKLFNRKIDLLEEQTLKTWSILTNHLPKLKSDIEGLL